MNQADLNETKHFQRLWLYIENGSKLLRKLMIFVSNRFCGSSHLLHRPYEITGCRFSAHCEEIPNFWIYDSSM